MMKIWTNGTTRINTRVLNYFTRVGTAFSVLLNVLIGGRSNQTLSARNWERKRLGKINLVTAIDFISGNPTHCLESWTYWRVRKDVQHELTNTLQYTIIDIDDTQRIHDGKASNIN